MRITHMFRPTTATLISAFLITVGASGLMYYSLLCALNGSGTDCLQLPVALQAVLILILWPWVAAVRVIGAEMIALASVLGFVLSLVWIFGVTCVGRYIKFRIQK